MAKKKDTKKITRNIIQVVLLSMIICVLVYGAYFLAKFIVKPSDVFMIEESTISETESLTGYIIREEILIKSENTEQELVEIKSEGEKVAKGEEVFRYKINNEEEISNQIQELDVQIQEALEGQTKIPSSDIKALEMQIQKNVEEIKGNNNIQQIEEIKKDITNYMTKKSKIAGELSVAGTYINNLIQQRINLENEIYNKSNYEVSPISGVVSYRVDGLEEELTKDNFEKLSTEYLKKLNLKTDQTISTNTNIGKVVNSFECYIAVPRKKDDIKEIKVGDKINLRISAHKTISSTVEYIKDEEDVQIIVFKITKGVEELIEYRKINLDIVWWEKEGLKVPNTALIYENGLSYVMRNKAGIKSKILVKIVKENKKDSIIDNYSTQELKDMGFSATEINSMSKISIYDEILVNPEVKDMADR